ALFNAGAEDNVDAVTGLVELAALVAEELDNVADDGLTKVYLRENNGVQLFHDFGGSHARGDRTAPFFGCGHFNAGPDGRHPGVGHLPETAPAGRRRSDLGSSLPQLGQVREISL